MRGTIKSFMVLCLLATALRSQEKSTPMKAVQRLNHAPVNTEVLQVYLPRPTRVNLKNGLTVLVLERHKLPTITAMLWIKTGALNDPKELPGLASFTADMLREGASKLTSEQISQELDSIGAELNAEAQFGQGVSRITASGLTDSADRLMELMSDVVINPSFPESELQKYKKRRQPHLEEERSDPGFLVREKFYRAVYQNFPASVVAPSAQSLAAVRTEDLRRYHDKYFVPDNAILGMAGDLTIDQAKALAEKFFGASHWQTAAPSGTSLPPIDAPNAKKIYLIDRPGSVQTEIMVGNVALKRIDPEYVPLRVLNRVLGATFASRLFLNLREEKGYTYGAYSGITANIYPGVFAARTEVRNEVTDGSMHELLRELSRIRDEPVPQEELEESSRSIVADFALSLEQTEELLEDWMTVEYYGLPTNYWDRYPDEVGKVTPEKIQQIARKYIDLDHLQIVCVGDGKQIRDVLQKYGPIEVIDTDGNPVEGLGAKARSHTD